MKKLITSESVTEGHPDKLCDQISDAILDGILEQDPAARVACECAVSTGLVLVIGEITTSCYVDINRIAREAIRNVGYDDKAPGFNADGCSVLVALNEQSADIALGVDNSLESKTASQEEEKSTGAGDQGMMYGFACNETDELMPMPISLAHSLARRLAEVRKDLTIPYLRPDGKTQVTVEYDGDTPKRIEAIVVSSQHLADASQEQLHHDIKTHVIEPIIPKGMIDDNTKIFINPTGRFVTGGPDGDAGLTGRKIIVDTYGGYAPHGGGAFSGKDPTKVDRSAAYMVRYIAKNFVKAGLASSCLIQVSYAIGVANPINVNVDTNGTGKLPDEMLSEIAQKEFDLRPDGIISTLDLRRPIFKQTASYGHFGRNDLDLPWERTDKAGYLAQKYLK
ncbi:MAG: methionine adenosyltransferase [Eubacteriaceae bacterium]|nr:methionine adenosyltransferase [Eubacteriaceae bacterium]